MCSGMGARELNHQASAKRNQADFSVAEHQSSLSLSLPACLCQLGPSLACDVEAPVVAALWAAPLPAASGCVWTMVLTEKQGITQMQGSDCMGG